MKRIYCDGIFDLFHTGHLKHFEKIQNLFDEPIILIVGIISDKIATDYKRKPILSQYNRFQIVKSCQYVNEVFITDVLIMDESFLNKYNIDYVVHGFTKEDREKQQTFFEIPIKLGKFKELDYHEGISTTELIKNPIVKNKTKRVDVINRLKQHINIKKNHTIGEFGYIDDSFIQFTNNYYCIDKDNSTNRNGPFIFINTEEKMFKYHFFHYIVVNNFEYSYDQHETFEMFTDRISYILKEFDRISKYGIYISGIKTIDKDFFLNKGYNIVEKNTLSNSGYDTFISYNEKGDYF
tara:strand:- start:8061 stop:8942 length:882 start_codon:yes stop_codon:yes gene_type:complete